MGRPLRLLADQNATSSRFTQGLSGVDAHAKMLTFVVQEKFDVY